MKSFKVALLVNLKSNAQEDWKPYILEINPLPGVSPVISDIVIEAAAEGVDHTELVNLILETALKAMGWWGRGSGTR